MSMNMLGVNKKFCWESVHIDIFTTFVLSEQRRQTINDDK